VLADPSELGVARQRAFQHRRGIHEHAVAERADFPRHIVRQRLQAVAHQLVVVAPQRIARHVGALAIGQVRPGGVRVLAVVHPDRDHPQRVRHQFGRPRALVAVPRHPFHRTVQALLQPVAQVGFVVRQFHPGNADPLEARGMRQRADALGQRGVIGCCGWHV